MTASAGDASVTGALSVGCACARVVPRSRRKVGRAASGFMETPENPSAPDGGRSHYSEPEADSAVRSWPTCDRPSSPLPGSRPSWSACRPATAWSALFAAFSFGGLAALGAFGAFAGFGFLHHLDRLGLGQHRPRPPLGLRRLQRAALLAQRLLLLGRRRIGAVRERPAHHGDMKPLAVLVELARERCGTNGHGVLRRKGLECKPGARRPQQRSSYPDAGASVRKNPTEQRECAMDITQLILDDHHEQRRLFAILEQIDRADRKRSARSGRGSRRSSEVHAEAEERHFYPALLRVGTGAGGKPNADDETEDAIKDHNEIRDAVAEVARHALGSDGWFAAVAGANKANSEHMGEEEREGLADFRGNADLALRHRARSGLRDLRGAPLRRRDAGRQGSEGLRRSEQVGGAATGGSPRPGSAGGRRPASRSAGSRGRTGCAGPCRRSRRRTPRA